MWVSAPSLVMIVIAQAAVNGVFFSQSQTLKRYAPRDYHITVGLIRYHYFPVNPPEILLIFLNKTRMPFVNSNPNINRQIDETLWKH